MVAICFASCLQSAYSGYTSSQITTLEKRFAIGSVIIGTINSFFEVGYVCSVMIVSYFGAKGRVPLWIACGLFVMSCGTFLFSTSQFLSPFKSSLSSAEKEHLCLSGVPANPSFSTNYCATKATGSYRFFPILLISQVLIGAGSSPILTLAPPFIDDHVPPHKAPAMIASLYAFAALGPVLGYALGALMLQHPMDKWSTRKIIAGVMTPSSQNWIGLWWAGYIVLGLGGLVGACILIMFPRTLHASLKRKISLKSDMVVCSNENKPVGDAKITDSKPNFSIEIPQPLVHLASQLSSTFRQSCRHPAAYQHHQRSFSGNMPITVPTTASSLGSGGTDQVAFSSRPHHQRSSSVSSIILHAAIIAATASHATEEEDESLSSTDTDSNSSWDVSTSPDPEEWLGGGQSFIDETMTESQRNTRLFRSTVYRTNSLSGGKPHQQSRGCTPTFLSPWSLSCGVSQKSGGPMSNLPQNISKPILDTMAEDGFTEEHANPEAEANLNHINIDASGTNDRSISPVVSQHLNLPIMNGDSRLPSHSSSPPAKLASKSPVFVHRSRHRKFRPHKIVRGRIFGFLADWSKDIPKAISRLLKNEIYVVTCLCICCEMFVVIGFAGFLPKYMEMEYGVSKSTASLIAGCLIVPSGAFGILAGGLILNKTGWSPKEAVLFVLGVNFCIIGCMCSFFFLGCENPKIAGFTVPYPVRSFAAENTTVSRVVRPWETACYQTCGCAPNVWKPVCHAETSTIFSSPCFAGCTKEPALSTSKQHVYHNCQCLQRFTDLLNTSEEVKRLGGMTSQISDDTVLKGVCESNCKMPVLFVCFLGVLLFLTGIIQNPLLMVTMRSVGHSQRSLALGLKFVIIRLVANMPSPITFGRVIDAACLLWKAECGRRGDCAFMDLSRLTQNITGLGLMVKGFSLFIYILLVYLLSRRCSSPLCSGADLKGKANDPADNGTQPTLYPHRATE